MIVVAAGYNPRPSRAADVVVHSSQMRRLARWLFTLCSVMSLLLFVAVCALWERSDRGMDSASVDDSPWRQDHHAYAGFWVKSFAGQLTIGHELYPFEPVPDLVDAPNLKRRLDIDLRQNPWWARDSARLTPNTRPR